MAAGKLDIRHLDFYTNGNEFTGNRGGLRFKIQPADGVFRVWTWTKDVCFELAQPEDPAEFPLTSEGLEQVEAHIMEKYAAASGT